MSKKKNLKKKINASITMKFVQPQLKVPHYPQPIAVYQIIGDFIIHDTMIAENSTTNSNCMVRSMNFYKKVVKVVYESQSLVSLYMTNFENKYSPSLDLLIYRLNSLADFDAKSLSDGLFKLNGMFSNFQNFLYNSLTMNHGPSNHFMNFEETKTNLENKFLQKLNLKKPFMMINSHFNTSRMSFEIYNIKLSSSLLKILGHKLDEFTEQCLVNGLPSIFVFDNYFTCLQTIIQSRLNNKQCFFSIKLITVDEDQVFAECRTHSCHTLNGSFFCSSFVIEFDVPLWSLKKYEEGRRNLKQNRMGDFLNERKKEVETFMKDFYPEEFEEKFQNLNFAKIHPNLYKIII